MICPCCGAAIVGADGQVSTTGACVTMGWLKWAGAKAFLPSSLRVTTTLYSWRLPMVGVRSASCSRLLSNSSDISRAAYLRMDVLFFIDSINSYIYNCVNSITVTLMTADQCVIVRLCSCKVTHSFLISVYSFSFLFHLCCKKLHSWEIKVKFASKFSRIFIEHTV